MYIIPLLIHATFRRLILRQPVRRRNCLCQLVRSTTSCAHAASAEAAEAKLARMETAPFPDETGFYGLIGDGLREAEKAMRKFPQPNYVISKVAEEAGEVVKAAIHCAEGRETTENLRGEMKQLIAMLYRLWVEGDGVHGLLPCSRRPTQAPPTLPKPRSRGARSDKRPLEDAPGLVHDKARSRRDQVAVRNVALPDDV